MGWMAAIAALFKPVLLPILSAIVGWVLPSPQELLRRKQEKIHEAELAGKDLDELP